MSRVRTALRFVAAVLMVSGALLVLDATTTLLWQEPISWGNAKTRQSDLERELAGIAGDSKGGDLAAAAARLADRTERGHALGRISMPTLRRSFVMVHGVGTSALPNPAVADGLQVTVLPRERPKPRGRRDRPRLLPRDRPSRPRERRVQA